MRLGFGLGVPLFAIGPGSVGFMFRVKGFRFWVLGSALGVFARTLGFRVQSCGSFYQGLRV